MDVTLPKPPKPTWQFRDDELPTINPEPYIISSRPVTVLKPKAHPAGLHFGFCILIIEPNHIVLPQRIFAIAKAFDCAFYDFAKISTKINVYRFLVIVSGFKYLHLYNDYDIVNGKLKFTNGDNYGQNRP